MSAGWRRLALTAALPAALVALPPAAAHAASPVRAQRFQIKGKSIVVPAPAGMTSVLGLEKRLDDFRRATMPERNELHATFVPDSEVGDYRRSRAGATPSGVSADFQSARHAPADDAEVRKAFAELRRQLPKQLEELYRKLSPRLRDQMTKAARDASALTKTPIDIQLGQVVPLGVVRNDEGVVAWLTLVRSVTSAGGVSDTSTQVVGSAAVNLRDRVTLLYYLERGDPPDLALNRVRPGLLAWVDDCRRANR